MEKEQHKHNKNGKFARHVLFGPCVEHLGLAPKNRKAIFPNKIKRHARSFCPKEAESHCCAVFLGVGEHADKDPQKEAPRCLNSGTKMYATGVTETWTVLSTLAGSKSSELPIGNAAFGFSRGWPQKYLQKKKDSYPIASMYGIFTYIWLIFMVNECRYIYHTWIPWACFVFVVQNFKLPWP